MGSALLACHFDGRYSFKVVDYSFKVVRGNRYERVRAGLQTSPTGQPVIPPNFYVYEPGVPSTGKIAPGKANASKVAALRSAHVL